MSRRDIGDITKLDEVSRRKFGKILGGIGVGSGVIAKALREVAGEPANGVDLVQTLDKNGNPDHIKTVPKERHRRIHAVKNQSVTNLTSNHPFINGFKAKQQSDDPTDLSFHLFIDDVSDKKKNGLPNKIKGMPVTTEVRAEQDATENDTWAQGCTVREDTLTGGIQIGGEGNAGTLATCAESSGTPVAITARHVARNNGSYQTLYQPAGTCDNVGDDDVIGTTAYTDDSDNDIARYEINESNFNYDVGEIYQAKGPISGSWTWQGVSDYTADGSTIDCNATSAHSGRVECTVNEATSKNAVEDAIMTDGNDFQDGDSGTAVLDEEVHDEKLMFMNTHTQQRFLHEDRQFGPVGEQVLHSTSI